MYKYVFRFFVVLTSTVLIVISLNCSSTNNSDDDATPKTETNPPLEKEKAITIPGAYFNDPIEIKNNGVSYKIIDNLISCINATPKEGIIHMNVYEFEYSPVAEALKKAAQRGVHLNIMIDSSKIESWEHNAPIVKELKKHIKEPSKLVLVHNDIAERAINHHKYVLFSELSFQNRDFQNVVFSTSSNFSQRQFEVLQDAIVVSDIELYSAFVNNWKEMESRTPTGMKSYDLAEYHSSNGKVEAYFYPRRKNGVWDGRETIIEILESLEEANYKNDTIKIGMAQWSSGDLQMAIVNKLIDISKKGGHVEVITRDETSSIGLSPESIEKLKELEKTGAYVKFLPNKNVIHSKYMMIKGVFAGKKRRLLLTGTLNFINSETKFNNNLVLIFNDDPYPLDFFNEYEKHYEDIKGAFF